MDKILIAMSGGVDSSVAAAIISKNGECIGATMKLFDDKGAFCTQSGKCADPTAIEDAKAVAKKLNIEYHIFPFQGDFENNVIKPFIDTYEKGGTPNPCIECNKNLKFGALLKKAQELGCNKIATGHYVSSEYKDGRWCIKKAVDNKKDQSYVLYSLSQEELSHTIFPLGNMKKDATRKIALENGFDNANRKESQDICFIPDGDYAAFIRRYTNKDYPQGNFIDKEGNILGKHKGIIKYTIGQRKGLGLALPQPMYVCSKDLKNNTVTLCLNDELFSKDVLVNDFNWVSMAPQTEPFKANARIRYNMAEAPCTVTPKENGNVLLTFDTAQRAVTSGQSAVVYIGDYVVGGGKII